MQKRRRKRWRLSLCYHIQAIQVLLTVFAALSHVAAQPKPSDFLMAPRPNADGYYFCKKIDVDYCQGLQYTHTMLPTPIYDDTTQTEAVMRVMNHKILLQSNCSNVMRHFVCSLYLPPCRETVVFQRREYKEETLGGVREDNSSAGVVVWQRRPCRELCEFVRQQCLAMVKTWGFDWPQQLACEDLVSINEDREGCYAVNSLTMPSDMLTTRRPVTEPTSTIAPFPGGVGGTMEEKNRWLGISVTEREFWMYFALALACIFAFLLALILILYKTMRYLQRPRYDRGTSAAARSISSGQQRNRDVYFCRHCARYRLRGDLQLVADMLNRLGQESPPTPIVSRHEHSQRGRPQQPDAQSLLSPADSNRQLRAVDEENIENTSDKGSLYDLPLSQIAWDQLRRQQSWATDSPRWIDGSDASTYKA